ncbi:MAG: hypothetical protein WAO35_13345 [Terriglobia bacterium]
MPSKHRKALFAVMLVVTCAATLRAQESPPPAPAARQELPPTNDPKEIVRRALDVDQSDFQLARNYTYEEREEMKVLGKGGAVKKREINTYDVTMVYGEAYTRRIGKNDKPLSEKDEEKEAEKANKFVAERENESEKEHQKRVEKQEKERQEERAFVRDIINAYDFQILGDEQVDGHDTFVIAATPRKDFRPTQPHADILPKLQGKLWISKKDYGWVKLDVETLDTISWGLLIMRIHKGAQIRFEQTRVNDEIWLPRSLSLNANMRVALVASGDIDMEWSYSKYKKFAVQVLPGAEEVKPTADPPRQK